MNLLSENTRCPLSVMLLIYTVGRSSFTVSKVRVLSIENKSSECFNARYMLQSLGCCASAFVLCTDYLLLFWGNVCPFVQLDLKCQYSTLYASTLALRLHCECIYLQSIDIQVKHAQFHAGLEL